MVKVIGCLRGFPRTGTQADTYIGGNWEDLLDPKQIKSSPKIKIIMFI